MLDLSSAVVEPGKKFSRRPTLPLEADGILARDAWKIVCRMNKRVAIVQSNYIPWRGYFDLINSVDEFILYDDAQYTKRDWRNRNVIKSSNGLVWLTIPVQVKGKYFQKIRQAVVADEKWSLDHWNVIIHNYSKARYFSQYPYVRRGALSVCGTKHFKSRDEFPAPRAELAKSVSGRTSISST